jgi:hypothetical protein
LNVVPIADPQTKIRQHQPELRTAAHTCPQAVGLSGLVGALVCRVPGIVHLDVIATAVYDDVHPGVVGP